MLRKKFFTIICAVLLAITCIGMVACESNEDDGEKRKPLHDSMKWFTEEELSAKGLAGLTAPTGLSGEMNSSDAWFNDGYSFSQVCPDEETFKVNAETYFSYLNTHYDGMFGKPRIEKYNMTTNENWYVIEQKSNLSDYFNDNPSKLYKFYYVRNNTLDNGYSGTNFERLGVKRLLDDAKAGEINTIVVKDLSRFGRNYILVGQYIDYVFPSFGIRFIAIEDRIDTESKDTSAMDMMPIMNVFNEWHSANTSKKIRAVKYSCAQAGKYLASKAPYGYVRKDDKNHTPIIDEEAAQVVRRIFERRAKGESAYRIALDLQADGISSPAVYAERKFGKKVTGEGHNYWSPAAVRSILAQQLYVGDLVQQRVKHISYKNKKVVKVPKEEQVIIPNNHEPIISRELWNKVKELEATASTGKITKERVTPALSGIMRCSTCGTTM